MITGRVIRTQSGFYTVETDAAPLVCRLRGRHKQGPRQGDVLAVGDWVQVTPLEDGTGIIEEIKPRLRTFCRMAPTPQGEYRQILIANPDQVVLIFACAQPAPHLGMLDRFLVIAEQQHVPALIIANKLDLLDHEQAELLFGHYEPLGYPVIYTSAKMQIGLDQLRARLVDRVSLFTGPSGVGKSSLLNALQPGLGLQVNQISQQTQKGRHTTVVRQLIPLDEGGYVADTPGLKSLALWDVSAEELDGYFPEIRQRIAACQFNDCTHVHEPGCAILQAVESGEIHPERYKSYLHIRFGEED